MCTVSSPAEAEKWSPEWWELNGKKVKTEIPVQKSSLLRNKCNVSVGLMLLLDFHKVSSMLISR